MRVREKKKKHVLSTVSEYLADSQEMKWQAPVGKEKDLRYTEIK